MQFDFIENAVPINDKCCLIAEGFKKLLQMITARRHSWEKKQQKFWLDRERLILKSTRPQGGKIKDKAKWMMTKSQARKDPSITNYIPFCKLKSENVTHEVDHECSWKRQNGDIRWF